jgi:inorganic pyrophosphatase
MDFWTRLDGLVASHELVIDRPRGTTHPRFPGLVYPLDYGYLKGTSGGDGSEVDVWRGSQTPSHLVAVVCTVDVLKGDVEAKLLLGCTVQEIDTVRRFHNENDYMSGMIIKRTGSTK